MSLDHRLIDLLVCPLCKGPLDMQRDADHRPSALLCPADRLAYPIRDGIPVMLESEARAVDTAASPAGTIGNGIGINSGSIGGSAPR